MTVVFLYRINTTLQSAVVSGGVVIPPQLFTKNHKLTAAAATAAGGGGEGGEGGENGTWALTISKPGTPTGGNSVTAHTVTAPSQPASQPASQHSHGTVTVLTVTAHTVTAHTTPSSLPIRILRGTMPIQHRHNTGTTTWRSACPLSAAASSIPSRFPPPRRSLAGLPEVRLRADQLLWSQH